MLLTLAIDCAMKWLNLGLADADKLYGEENMNVGNQQSERLPLAVDRFLAYRGVSLRDIGQIAVTVGPGYYTGIRVGLSYASALAESLGIPLVPVTTLHALAYNLLPSPFIVVPVLRANKDGLYGAIYEDTRTDDRQAAASFYEIDEFLQALHSFDNAKTRVLLLGSDACEYSGLEGSGFAILPMQPSVGLALASAAQGMKAEDPASVRAMYIRSPD